MGERQPAHYVSRVNQLDADRLNRDITRLLRDNLLNNIQALAPKLYFKIQPELDLLIQTAIWLGGVGRDSSTFGQQLMALRYDAEQMTLSKKILHYVLSVVLQYVRNCSESRLSQRYIWLFRTVATFEKFLLMLSVLNFFRFLRTGRRPTLIDYTLGLDHRNVQHNQLRDVGYEYLTRELLWTGFMETLGVLLPIVNFRKLQRWSRNTVNLAKRSLGFRTECEANDVYHCKPDVLPTTMCSYCGKRPTLPYHMGCTHVYCYYCLAANICTDSKFTCVQCERPADSQAIQPL